MAGAILIGRLATGRLVRTVIAPKKEVQEFAISLKGKYELYMLSNFGKAFWSMFDKWGLDKIFPKENVIVSSDIGMAKPDEDIFLYALEKWNVKPENAVFIDDNLDNIATACKLGINGILFEDLVGLKRDLREMGVVSS